MVDIKKTGNSKNSAEIADSYALSAAYSPLADLLSDQPAPPARKPYHCPDLQTFGSVKSLTQGTGSANGDGGAMMDSMSMSDWLTKNIVAKVGQHPAGFGLYLYHYKPEFAFSAGGEIQFGVLAQEVAAVVPGVVGVGKNGYLQVDYQKLGISRGSLQNQQVQGKN